MSESYSSSNSNGRRPFPWWVILGAILIPCLYLPTLATRFDFIDDGNLVYPHPPLSIGEHVELTWNRIVSNYEHLGPFRPVLWIHWEIFAEMNQGREVAWRLTRLLWCMLATGMLLLLLRELGVSPVAALAASALTMWNPYRNEIWVSNTLAEGVAMPYALFSLYAARRATRSPRPWLWDVAGACGVLAALGCKNTFVALVPAQMFLRFAIDDASLGVGWRRYRWRALLLGSTMVAPIAHFVYFKLHWHAGQYVTHGPSLVQLRRILLSMQGAMSLDFMGLGIGLASLTIVLTRRNQSADCGWGQALRAAGVDLWRSHRAAIGAAILLLFAGVIIYLPMDAMSGRYVMPGIWGLDIFLGIGLTAFLAIASTPLKRVAWCSFALGLIAVAMANVGKQEKLAARTKMLWETLEWVEQNVPPGSRIAWIGGEDSHSLNIEEGIHFRWHLEARNRSDLQIALYDERSQLQKRTELKQFDGEPDYRIVGSSGGTERTRWREERRFAAGYWANTRRYESAVERPTP
jgi:hypothetical protein